MRPSPQLLHLVHVLLGLLLLVATCQSQSLPCPSGLKCVALQAPPVAQAQANPGSYCSVPVTPQPASSFSMSQGADGVAHVKVWMTLHVS